MRFSRAFHAERAGALSRRLVLCVAASAFAAWAGAPLAAQQPDRSARDTTSRGDTLVYLFSPLAVTTTRTAKELFVTPAPVSIFTRTQIREARPRTVTDLFRDVPGLDVTGVGAQQPRPMIRGQRGQRILLLQDGLRLNNARRQQDFGEIPALVDVASVERVEVVRGPASVLYGTDAIGGVINIITRRPTREGFHGTAGYRFGSAAGTHKGSASLFGRFGALDVSADVAVRNAGAYEAPSGRFGDITLTDDATVTGTGVEDLSVGVRLGYDLTQRYRVFGSFDRYEAQNSGFGAVAPAAYAPDQPSIDIRYPDQRFARATIGFAGTDLHTPIADRLEATGYVQDNERTLTFDLFQSFGPQAPPGAGIAIDQSNFTDLHTLGFRIEAKKLASDALLFTYGIDFTRDGAEGSDSSVTTISGFGPPQQEVSTRPQIPNAFFRSLGAFAQGEATVGRATVIVGGRVQRYHAETEPTAGLDIEPASKTNRTVVGSVNAVFALSEHVNLIGTVGRAFRSPNLIEYFFDGPTPEGNGYQIRSPDLEPETSLNVDLGARYRDRRLAVEAFVFRNSVRDGIRIEATGTEIDGLPAFRNVNVDELLYRGVELNGELLLPHGFSIGGGFTAIESDNERDPEIPVGETYSSKLTGALRYRHPDGRFWAEYSVRHNGEQKDVVLDENPIGDVLPAFTVHSARAGVTLLRSGPFSHRLGLTVHNLTDVLYAESSNASFFRPEPGRSVIVTYDVSF